ncbi:MAG: DNA repair protein RecN [Thermodesulfovibrio sp.]|nr:DNA repair protein RecN [Thermodesulfovibrio sp.]
MIEELRIKNFAIIDSLTIPLGKGFNVLTGETGAGKSIIVDAISVLLKEKVSALDFVKHGKNEAYIEAVVYTPGEKEFEINDEVIILKKILNIHGKTKTYINDSAFTVHEFAKIASKLINIHGQHEHTYLLKKENHILFFDTIANLREEVERFNQIYMEVQNLKKELEETKKDISLKKQRTELLQFQINEIRNANLKEGQEEELLKQREILRNVLKLKELAEMSFSLLYGDKASVYTNLSKVLSFLKELSKFDSKAEEVKNLIESAFTQTEEAIYILRRLKDSYEPDPKELEKIEEKLTLINKLKLKYGSTIKEIMEYAKKAEDELSNIFFSKETLKNKEEKLKRLSDEMISLADEISYKRRSLKSKIEDEIINELKFLGFLNPSFEIRINEKEISLHGKDEIEFYFSSNPGEPPKPLVKVASGGELSRLMLALKCVELKLAKDSIKSMTLIFDEIDAGIGGIVAENIGRRLKELSKHHQVLCVTHLPQIAAQAQHHLKVEKFILDNKTFVKVEVLKGKKRKEEIARMLSGRITESSLFHAEELLENQ